MNLYESVKRNINEGATKVYDYDDIEVVGFDNQFNTTVKQARIDHKNKTFKQGSFKIISDKKLTRKAYYSLLEDLKHRGYKELHNKGYKDLNESESTSVTPEEVRGDIFNCLEMYSEDKWNGSDDDYAQEVLEQNLYDAILAVVEKHLGLTFDDIVNIPRESDPSTIIYNQFLDYVYAPSNKELDADEAIKVFVGMCNKVIKDYKSLKESSTEEYWDAKEITRDGFLALLKFNFGTNARGANYIMTIDDNEINEFYAKDDKEAIKEYKQWKEKMKNKVDWNFHNNYKSIAPRDVSESESSDALAFSSEICDYANSLDYKIVEHVSDIENRLKDAPIGTHFYQPYIESHSFATSHGLHTNESKVYIEYELMEDGWRKRKYSSDLGSLVSAHDVAMGICHNSADIFPTMEEAKKGSRDVQPHSHVQEFAPKSTVDRDNPYWDGNRYGI